MTYSIKDKNMINTNRAVIVRFPAAKTNGSADIYVPFPVKEINVKGVDVDWGHDYSAVIFNSTLVSNGPIGGAFCGISSDFSTSTIKLRFIFDQPLNVNGNYQFTYKLIDTVSDIAYPDTQHGHVCFMLEFIGYV